MYAMCAIMCMCYGGLLWEVLMARGMLCVWVPVECLYNAGYHLLFHGTHPSFPAIEGERQEA